MAFTPHAPRGLYAHYRLPAAFHTLPPLPRLPVLPFVLCWFCCISGPHCTPLYFALLSRCTAPATPHSTARVSHLSRATHLPVARRAAPAPATLLRGLRTLVARAPPHPLAHCLHCLPFTLPRCHRAAGTHAHFTPHCCYTTAHWAVGSRTCCAPPAHLRAAPARLPARYTAVTARFAHYSPRTCCRCLAYIAFSSPVAYETRREHPVCGRERARAYIRRRTPGFLASLRRTSSFSLCVRLHCPSPALPPPHTHCHTYLRNYATCCAFSALPNAAAWVLTTLPALRALMAPARHAVSRFFAPRRASHSSLPALPAPTCCCATISLAAHCAHTCLPALVRFFPVTRHTFCDNTAGSSTYVGSHCAWRHAGAATCPPHTLHWFLCAPLFYLSLRYRRCAMPLAAFTTTATTTFTPYLPAACRAAVRFFHACPLPAVLLPARYAAPLTTRAPCHTLLPCLAACYSRRIPPPASCRNRHCAHFRVLFFTHHRCLFLYYRTARTATYVSFCVTTHGLSHAAH